MRSRRFAEQILRVTLALVCAACALAAQAQTSTTLVLGRVSDDPKAHYERLKPLLDYAVAHMADLGIREGRVLMARDAQQMVSYLRQGKVDWISETSGAAIGFEERAHARILLRARRGGLFDYRTVFFARKDSGIRSIDQLAGRSLGFQHPMSTSAYLVPAAILLDRGLSLAIQSSPLERPPAQFVGYVFSRSEGNLVTWVQKGLVDAAAFSNQDWDELQVNEPEVAAELMVFHQSREYPRAVELVRDGLDPRIEQRLREVLLAAHTDPAAHAALEAYTRTERFDEVDAATWASLSELRIGVRRVRAEIE
ncbi:MAG: phosphate/phosphite/phosphonate ABC transporter substrate-binding protein [Rhodanobacteraceae bacterium]|nr:phosphate/phosphite/phosphonate ABC transporter substrate-binding protein [Rhodanobacteraceae bacterium]